jgi:hypothetical protein
MFVNFPTLSIVTLMKFLVVNSFFSSLAVRAHQDVGTWWAPLRKNEK